MLRIPCIARHTDTPRPFANTKRSDDTQVQGQQRQVQSSVEEKPLGQQPPVHCTHTRVGKQGETTGRLREGQPTSPHVEENAAEIERARHVRHRVCVQERRRQHQLNKMEGNGETCQPVMH